MSKCVVACSGGPDSMALLDQLNKQGKDIVVAHVNYKHRDTADRDEKIVKEYCKKYDIPVYANLETWNAMPTQKDKIKNPENIKLFNISSYAIDLTHDAYKVILLL